MICILGGLGYIGRHVSLVFLERAHHILIVGHHHTASDTMIGSLREKFPFQKIYFEWCDLTNKAGLTTLFLTYRVSTVIYPLRNSFLNNTDTFMINYNIVHVLGNITNAIAATPSITKFIMVSNTDIYAGNGPPRNNTNGQYDKKDGFNAQHPYAFLVYLKEKMAHDFYNTCKRLALVILRVSVPVGSHDMFYSTAYNHPDKLSRSFQHNLLNHYATHQKELLPIYKCTSNNTIDGSVCVNFISVKDVATVIHDAYEFLLQQPRIFKIYNVAYPYTSCPTAIQWLRTIIFTNEDIPSPRFQLISSPQTQTPIKLYNIEETKSDLNWTLQHNPQLELTNLVSWVIQQFKL